MTIKVFGHKAPDTDSTGSPIIWAWYLSEVRGTPAEPKLLGEPNPEAKWMLSRWGLDQPEIIADVGAEDRCVLVDTNNPAELPEGIGSAEVLEIIDHHLLVGGLKTRTPITITMRPLACTATVIHGMMGEVADRMPDAIKGAMLTCILSDTLAFRSPTTTGVDRELAESLARELGIQIPAYAAEMFAAKSDVSHLSNKELLTLDSKEYVLGGKDLRISVVETTSPDAILSRKESLLASMGELAQEQGIDQVMFFVVDILNEEATLLIPNDYVRRVAVASFGTEPQGDTLVLPGVMSRKKQIIPVLKA